MWKTGDECNVIAQDGTVITDCEIREIVPFVELAMIRHKSGLESLVASEDILCIHLRGNLDMLTCPWALGGDVELCEMCPNAIHEE
ncbi:hypothetical protein [Tolypothrix sp. PCC 7601]|uniref:hypothetical protein n=1 Tax=Tolypothrix sp. PCC 7601 TaxID=1188 RepID=UPI0021E0E857|nr:hypothetical protein [Tolypothrix sp. PCC 7601]